MPSFSVGATGNKQQPNLNINFFQLEFTDQEIGNVFRLLSDPMSDMLDWESGPPPCLWWVTLSSDPSLVINCPR